jgi:hypothetical protein
MTTATFKAYQGADRDNLISKLVQINGWSHIGQVRASPELNHVEVNAYFAASGVRLKSKIKGATILGAWRLQSIK